jgi:cation:H+ antiporter
LKAGISPLIAGLTIVAFGNSSSELVVSVHATIAGHGNIAIGNLIGSTLFNIFMILGISAVVAPLKVRMKLFKIEIPVLILSATVFMLFFADRQISRSEGGILLFGLILYIILKITLVRREKSAAIHAGFENSMTVQKMKLYRAVGMVVFGIALLIAGSELLIKSAIAIARSLEVGETIIGLTIIAAVSSIPLLVFSIVASIRKEYDLAIGNVIGASIINVLGTIGISALIDPLSALAISNIDLYVMIGGTLLLLQFFRSRFVMKRDDGIFMIVMYVVYLYYLWPK